MARRDVTRADEPPAPVLGASRARVLAVVQQGTGAIGVEAVADRVGLHPNTVRFHLDALVRAGLASRTSEEREQPGRPRLLYTANADGVAAGRRSYRLLAEILAGYLAGHSEEPARAAREAGQAWGRFLTDRRQPFGRIDASEATDQLVTMLDEVGFAPEVSDGGRQVLLHHCPFRETAVLHRDVVCSIHLGLMRGMLAELDAPLQAERLDPFVEPSLCVTHLTPRAGAST